MIHNESAASEDSEGVDTWGATTFLFCQDVNSGTHTIQNLFSWGGGLFPNISNIYICLLFVWILGELVQFFETYGSKYIEVVCQSSKFLTLFSAAQRHVPYDPMAHHIIKSKTKSVPNELL